MISFTWAIRLVTSIKAVLSLIAFLTHRNTLVAIQTSKFIGFATWTVKFIRTVRTISITIASHILGNTLSGFTLKLEIFADI